MAWDLSGKTVFITGAARGIGAASARSVAKRGANVALVGLEAEELEKVAAEIGTERALSFECDVRDRDALDAAVTGTVERFGGIDVVMANAGIASGGVFNLSDPDIWERTIDVNLMGATRTVRACLSQILERKGYVFVVASVAAAVHGPGMANYAASKAGVEAFSDSLRNELRHHGVDVAVGYFSWIDTEMVAGADRHPAFGFARAKLPGPFGKTYPVEKVGEAVADGIERRRRWIVVPGWARLILLTRGFNFPIFDAGGRRHTIEMEERFERDIAERGRERASAPVGAGGEAFAREEGSLNRS
jgi:NAD(P)-dependent dehydrogenase (short-subunit alcohol dehydrogenase family)